MNRKFIRKSLKESTKKHLVKGLDVDFVVDHLLSLEDSDNFNLIHELGDLWEVYNKSWNKFNKSLSDFWKVMKNIEKLDSFDKTCGEIIDAWYDDIEKIFYSDDNPENLKLNYGFRGNDIFEPKKSIKEEINRPTWSKWVVDKVYNVYGFFDGEEVNGRVIDNLLNELGINTDFDTVKNEIIKGIKSYKLGDLDYWAIHIGHGANGNRFDIHGRVAYSSELTQLIDKDGTVTVYFDVQEQGEDDAWNFGFIADVGVKIRPVIDTNLVESLKESVDGYIATDEDCNMSGKCWVLDGSYNFIMEFLQEWGIAPKDVKVKNGMTTLYNADGNPFGYVYQDEEVDIFVADKTTNWTWENHNPSTKRVKVTALDEIF